MGARSFGAGLSALDGGRTIDGMADNTPFTMDWLDPHDMAATRAFYEVATDFGIPMDKWDSVDPLIRDTLAYDRRLLGLRVLELWDEILKEVRRRLTRRHG